MKMAKGGVKMIDPILQRGWCQVWRWEDVNSCDKCIWIILPSCLRSSNEEKVKVSVGTWAEQEWTELRVTLFSAEFRNSRAGLSVFHQGPRRRAFTEGCSWDLHRGVKDTLHFRYQEIQSGGLILIWESSRLISLKGHVMQPQRPLRSVRKKKRVSSGETGVRNSVS